MNQINYITKDSFAPPLDETIIKTLAKETARVFIIFDSVKQEFFQKWGYGMVYRNLTNL